MESIDIIQHFEKYFQDFVYYLIVISLENGKETKTKGETTNARGFLKTIKQQDSIIEKTGLKGTYQYVLYTYADVDIPINAIVEHNNSIYSVLDKKDYFGFTNFQRYILQFLKKN